MIQSATFSMDESQNILKTFLIDYDQSKVIEKFVKYFFFDKDVNQST